MGEKIVGADALNGAFSQIHGDEEFPVCFESFINERELFAVLVIRVDDFETILVRSGEADATNVLLKVSRVIDGLSKTVPIVWGRISRDEFGCLCQDMDESAGLKLAREIQRRLQLIGRETVSIGLAVHPFWPFEKTAILDNARKALDHAAFFGPNTVTPFDAVSLNISADKLYQYDDIKGAIEEFKSALAVDPKNVNVYNSLGVCYGVAGELDAAVDAFETAINLSPEDVMATFNLGLAHFKKGDKEKALKLFHAAHELHGGNPEVAYQIGLCYQERKQFDQAIAYFHEAGEETQKGAHVFRALGECYAEKQMLKEAVKAYEKAIRRNPRDARSLSALGELYGMMGENLEIAVVLCRESTEIAPDNGLYRIRLARLYQQSGDHQKAAEQFKIAGDLGEDSPDVSGETQAEALNDA